MHTLKTPIFPPTLKKASATFHQGEGIRITSCPVKPCWGQRVAQGTFTGQGDRLPAPGLAAGVVAGLGAHWPRAPAPHKGMVGTFLSPGEMRGLSSPWEGLDPHSPSPTKKDQGEKTLKPTKHQTEPTGPTPRAGGEFEFLLSSG